MKYFKKLEGERIYFSPVSIEDAEIYTKWMNDEVICKNTNNMSRVTSLFSEKNWLTQDHPYTFAILKKENDELIGNIGLESVDFLHQNAELGIMIGEEKNRHSGYGSEAIRLMLKYCFQFLNFHSIQLTVLSFHNQAISCYKKIGFQEVGRIKEVIYMDDKYYDRIIMQLLKKDWRENDEE